MFNSQNAQKLGLAAITSLALASGVRAQSENEGSAQELETLKSFYEESMVKIDNKEIDPKAYLSIGMLPVENAISTVMRQ